MPRAVTRAPGGRFTASEHPRVPHLVLRLYLGGCGDTALPDLGCLMRLPYLHRGTVSRTGPHDRSFSTVWFLVRPTHRHPLLASAAPALSNGAAGSTTAPSCRPSPLATFPAAAGRAGRSAAAGAAASWRPHRRSIAWLHAPWSGRKWHGAVW
eukprot:39607-Chlamydomonas_euryale.AAC.1